MSCNRFSSLVVSFCAMSRKLFIFSILSDSDSSPEVRFNGDSSATVTDASVKAILPASNPDQSDDLPLPVKAPLRILLILPLRSSISSSIPDKRFIFISFSTFSCASFLFRSALSCLILSNSFLASSSPASADSSSSVSAYTTSNCTPSPFM